MNTKIVCALADCQYNIKGYCKRKIIGFDGTSCISYQQAEYKTGLKPVPLREEPATLQ